MAAIAKRSNKRHVRLCIYEGLLMRFELKTYEKKGSKKVLKSERFKTPMEARLSDTAKEAEYYEIYDHYKKRMIEIKIN